MGDDPGTIPEEKRDMIIDRAERGAEYLRQALTEHEAWLDDIRAGGDLMQEMPPSMALVISQFVGEDHRASGRGR